MARIQKERTKDYCDYVRDAEPGIRYSLMRETVLLSHDEGSVVYNMLKERNQERLSFAAMLYPEIMLLNKYFPLKVIGYFNSLFFPEYSVRLVKLKDEERIFPVCAYTEKAKMLRKLGGNY